MSTPQITIGADARSMIRALASTTDPEERDCQERDIIDQVWGENECTYPQAVVAARAAIAGRA